MLAAKCERSSFSLSLIYGALRPDYSLKEENVKVVSFVFCLSA